MTTVDELPELAPIEVDADGRMLRPLHDRVLVERVSEHQLERPDSPIVDPEYRRRRGQERKERARYGTVVAIGSEVTGVEPGELIVYEDFAAIPLKLGGAPTHIIDEDHMLAVLEP